MHLLRFLALLFALIGILAGCAVTVALLVLALRFWPVLLIFALAISLFGWLLKRIGIRITSRH
ncbi:TPA: hypothetical protein L5D50_000824 [Pseudomonas aeruginosa]|uniref:hypothetical protein n=1 Tax=Pseudomonas aeruginosa TaxID=287 RepID=UPI001571720B|nr:hypothetical protein [Pseudomonas aeruginosa]MCV4188830.1 hypothetical protein [Pseudomonas aeruginosa]NTS92716.1 hypothetical protein [Pseudomonas aeruginosa]HBO9053363.1 hypothetical protein [Pseudomonas aeruginosa]HBO9142669.1 hypothetical protein [Pseudomonas aeruginosa]HBO9245753.1 hypothetical protein [Pseudomonas aeruginosa]